MSNQTPFGNQQQDTSERHPGLSLVKSVDSLATWFAVDFRSLTIGGSNRRCMLQLMHSCTSIRRPGPPSLFSVLLDFARRTAFIQARGRPWVPGRHINGDVYAWKFPFLELEELALRRDQSLRMPQSS
jgi:hypothetical protein